MDAFGSVSGEVVAVNMEREREEIGPGDGFELENVGRQAGGGNDVRLKVKEEFDACVTPWGEGGCIWDTPSM